VLSALGYAILALLAARPQSGYDLARQMRPPFGYLWQARHGQIYPELARLVKSGLVDIGRVDKYAGPPRRVHSLTPAGRIELSAWVLRPTQIRPSNDEFLVKAYALRRVRPAAATKLLHDQIKLHDERLGALEQMYAVLEARLKSNRRLDPAPFGEFAALHRAVSAERDYISWCRWLLEQLKSVPRRTTSAPNRRAGPSSRSSAGRRRGREP
jgi:DNA-binding PadR family transcriptional regulator